MNCFLLLAVLGLAGTLYAAPCGDTQVAFGNRCYQAFRPAAHCSRDFSFSDARAHCRALGGELASVHSQAQANAITALIQNSTRQTIQRHCRHDPDDCRKGDKCACQHANRDYFYWIGLRLNHAANGAVNGSSWTDGSVVDYGNPQSANFRPPFVAGRPIGEFGPDEACPDGNTNNCVQVYGYGRNLGRWRDQNCNDAQQIPRCNCTAPSPKRRHHHHSSSSSEEEREPDNQCRDDDALNGAICVFCPPGWTPFQGHCYKAVGGGGTAAQFEERCADSLREFGSKASSIHNRAENEFTIQLVNASFPDARINYLPLRLVHASNAANAPVTQATWTDGSPADYGNPSIAPWSTQGTYPWMDAQPNNRVLPADCVHQNLPAHRSEEYLWNDEPCTANKHTAVCKIL